MRTRHRRAPTAPILRRPIRRPRAERDGGTGAMKLIPGRRSPEERTGSMSVVEHLEELRRRIVICLWAVGIAGIVAWFLYEPFIDVIRAPYCDFARQNP